jgi:hypothetical protein
MMTLEEALGLQGVTITPELKTEITPKQAPIAPTPPTTPTKIDIILDLIDERERLKQIREEVATGARKADKELTAEMYLTQLVISANKTVIDALKETNINLTQNNYVDISTQVNEVIRFSRERQCSKNKSQDTS